MAKSDRRRLILEHALLAGVTGGVSWFAWQVHPAWDEPTRDAPR